MCAWALPLIRESGSASAIANADSERRFRLVRALSEDRDAIVRDRDESAVDIECGLASVSRLDPHHAIGKYTEERGVVRQYTDITFEGAR